ncbi:hypothetical protein SAMN02745181_3746 [Rubritalea squalenifaciens DSM 18772]|uniref:Uncharacterized protein n=1 Tax=Rubritalea squalenifaciens DSM 18772 TaxID=1123071 RepID=A0A1M6S8E0_9BACT|nr:hypothetical protein [Rubritalea squalenifaciens]SHK40808.1 hypothetical protein SAMN02745181_3746 [Rubritalea squalenifaciens DSM 18772]
MKSHSGKKLVLLLAGAFTILAALLLSIMYQAGLLPDPKSLGPVLHFIPFIVLFTLCTSLALRWQVRQSPETGLHLRALSWPAYFTVCLLATYATMNWGTRISQWTFDPADFPGDKGITAEFAYSGDTNPMFAILFSPFVAFLCRAIARFIQAKRDLKQALTSQDPTLHVEA